jgi:hypothetical protein
MAMFTNGVPIIDMLTIMVLQPMAQPGFGMEIQLDESFVAVPGMMVPQAADQRFVLRMMQRIGMMTWDFEWFAKRLAKMNTISFIL